MDKEMIQKKGNPADLSSCMSTIIGDLKKASKHSAVHVYTCTLNSFTEFSGGSGTVMLVDEAFTIGKLKAYQEWLLKKELSWNSVSTYLRTLRAVCNRLFPPGSPGYAPHLFDDVYTKVESRTKRALTEEQMHSLLVTDPASLPEDVRDALFYFLLMFLFRGMPFIDLAHLRKRDVKGDMIVYCRHKTGKQMTVRIPREAVPLMKELSFKNRDSIYLFPILGDGFEDDEMYCRYLTALRRFNKKLGKLAALLLPGVKISSYTARHTWATLSFHLGIPVGIISEALGHSSVRVTENYLKPFGNERVDRANDKLIISVIKRRAKTGIVYNRL